LRSGKRAKVAENEKGVRDNKWGAVFGADGEGRGQKNAGSPSIRGGYGKKGRSPRGIGILTAMRCLWGAGGVARKVSASNRVSIIMT